MRVKVSIKPASHFKWDVKGVGPGHWSISCEVTPNCSYINLITSS